MSTFLSLLLYWLLSVSASWSADIVHGLLFGFLAFEGMPLANAFEYCTYFSLRTVCLCCDDPAVLWRNACPFGGNARCSGPAPRSTSPANTQAFAAWCELCEDSLMSNNSPLPPFNLAPPCALFSIPGAQGLS